MHKFLLPFGAVVFILGFLAFFYITSTKDFVQFFTSLTQEKTAVAYAALPNDQNDISGTVNAQDGRVENLQNMLLRYHSILADYANYIVSEADLYGIDYRLVPSIAMHESGGCKIIPVGSNNCWGLGVYGKQAMKFDNYPEAIDTVTKTLAQHYVAKGLSTPEAIMPVWDPASAGTWAKGVRFFMDQM